MAEQTAEEFDPKASGWLTLDEVVQALRQRKVFLGRGKPERLIAYLQATKVIEPPRHAPTGRRRGRKMASWYPPTVVNQIEQFRLGGEGDPRIVSPRVTFWIDLSNQFYAHATPAEQTDILLHVSDQRSAFLRSLNISLGEIVASEDRYLKAITRFQPSPEDLAKVEEWVVKSKADSAKRLEDFALSPPTPAEIHVAVVDLFAGEVIVQRVQVFVVTRLLREFAEIQRGLDTGDEGGAYTRAANAAETAPYAEQFLIELINALAAKINPSRAEAPTIAKE